MSNGNDRLLSFKRWLRGHLSPERREALGQRFSEPLGFVFQSDLPKLAVIYGTDKWGVHLYASHYARHFHHLRRKRITLLEIGIGGWDDPRQVAVSGWYFPNARIVLIRLFRQEPARGKRIRIYRGDQSDEKLLRQIIADVGRPDIIVDDGSHMNRHVQG
jgi:hypothetical protein